MSAPSPDWLSFEAAREAMLARCLPLGGERVQLADALGRALTEDVVSPVAHPAWDNSAMDGFAVRAEDVRGARPDGPIRLPLAGEVRAGQFPHGPLAPGTVVRIMTGAAVPAGATGVVRLEHTDAGRSGAVTFFQDSDAERNIRRAGEDVRTGALLLRAGQEVTPAVVGLLAMAGRREVLVGRRPQVGVLANGDELADLDELDEVLAGRRIVNCNSHALMAQLRTVGAEPVDLGIAADDPASVRERLSAGAGCDAIISSAGISVGDHDYIKAALEEMGMNRLLWRVRIRPGSPITFGLLGGRPFWGLPGNPVSAMVTFEVFLRPALRKMAGHAVLHRRTLRARTREAIQSVEALTHFLRVRIQPVPGSLPYVELTGPQGSGILTSMTAADGLLVVPEGTERLEPETPVEVIPLRE